MARARNIKPGFFLNDILAGLSALHRLLFIGLWTIADRDGRVFDRPNQIKASVLPYDNCNPSRMLQDLHESGFILRYTSQGINCIQVINFSKHQNPHIKESKSTIPAPDLHQTEHQTSTEVARLIPDSLNLMPDSGCPDSLVPSKTKAKPRKNGHDVEPLQLPEWIPLDQWQAWIEARTKKRNAPTQWAMKLAVIKLEHLRKDGHSVARILADSAFNGWAGLFPPKD